MQARANSVLLDHQSELTPSLVPRFALSRLALRAQRPWSGLAFAAMALCASAWSLELLGQEDTGLAAGVVPVSYVPPPSTTSDPVHAQIEQAIAVTSNRFLTANLHTPWQIFHGVLAMHEKFEVKLNDQRVSAVKWLSESNPVYRGEHLVLISPHGARFHPYGDQFKWVFQGHPGQFLALLSESKLPPSHKFSVDAAHTVTIQDFLNDLMRECNSREEVTWVLWAMVNYYPVETSWANQWGEAWSIEKLVEVQTNAKVVGGACGGNHGLFALSRARDKYLASGKPLRGVWLQADQKIRQYIEIARSLQNTDGSLSADFYAGPKISQDANSRLNTTGHTFEFLAAGLPDTRLNEPWVRNAAAALSKDLIEHRRSPIDCGPLYHSLNALVIYQSRVRPETRDQQQPAEANADRPTSSAANPAAPAASTSKVPSALPASVAASPLPKVALAKTPMPLPSALSAQQPLGQLVPPGQLPSADRSCGGPVLGEPEAADGEADERAPVSAMSPTNSGTVIR